jgi:protein TonB
MAAYVQDTSFLSRRAIVFVVIVAFHILLIYGLANGLARRVVEVIAPPIQADISEKVEKRDEPPPPPPPPMERQQVEIPPPDVDIQIPVEAPPTAITQVTTTPQPKPVAPPPRAVVRVAPKLDQRRSPTTDDYYPPPSRRAGEEGITTIHACVSADGRTAGTATVEKSSGFPRLDDAAVKWAARARWTPATEDGKPIDGGCSQFNVRFKLTD